MLQCASSLGGGSLSELCKKTVTFFRVGETSPRYALFTYRVAQKGVDTAFLLLNIVCEMYFASLCVSYFVAVLTHSLP